MNVRDTVPPAAMTPPPAAVHYNDWRQIAVAPADAFVPEMPASVILACYAEQQKLEKLLAALEGQTYPRDLFEVIVVDDGSQPPLDVPPSTPLDVRVVRQKRRGYGGERARNTGLRHAAHDVLLFLDGDMLPEAGWLAAHARWHHAAGDLLTLGPRVGIEVDDLDAQAIRERPATLRELFEGRPSYPEAWVQNHLDRTRELTSRDDTPFLVMVGANFGIGRALYELAGGIDESFTGWGLPDTELAWRVYIRGGVFVPVREAFAWHQGRLDEGSEHKRRSWRRQRVKAAHLIAHEWLRDARAGCAFTVPRYVVTVDAGALPVEPIARTVETILADPEHDLVVRIELPAGDDRREPLADRFGPDPRVRVGPTVAALDEFPAAPFHVTVPAGLRIARGVVRRLRLQLGPLVSAAATLPDGSRVEIVRAWALHRARRTAGRAADFGEAATVSPRRLRIGRPPGPAGRIVRDRAGRVYRRLRPALSRLGRVRTLRQAGWFLAWLAGAVRWAAVWRWRAFRALISRQCPRTSRPRE